MCTVDTCQVNQAPLSSSRRQGFGDENTLDKGLRGSRRTSRVWGDPHSAPSTYAIQATLILLSSITQCDVDKVLNKKRIMQIVKGL